MSDLDSLKKRAIELLAKARREERRYSRKAKALEAGYVHPDDEAAVKAIIAALAARAPEGEPVANRVIYPDGSRPSKWDSGKGYWPQVEGIAGTKFEYAFLPAPAAVPVDVSTQEMEWLHYAIDHMLDDSEPEDHACAKALQALVSRLAANHCFATHPQPVAAHTCNWPDCGHDTNQTGYSPGCTGKFCKPDLHERDLTHIANGFADQSAKPEVQ